LIIQVKNLEEKCTFVSRDGSSNNAVRRAVVEKHDQSTTAQDNEKFLIILT